MKLLNRRAAVCIAASMRIFASLTLVFAGVGSVGAQSQLKVIDGMSFTSSGKQVKVTGDAIAKLASLSDFDDLTLIRMTGDAYTGPPVDLTILNTLHGVQALDFTNLPVRDWSVLDSTSVNALTVRGDIKLGDFSPDLLARLEYLTVWSPHPDVLVGVKDLGNLKQLQISGATITDLRDLPPVPKLEQLTLLKSQVVSLRGLEVGASLIGFNAQETPLAEMTELANAPNLKWVNVSASDISSIEPLRGKEKMTALLVGKTRVKDLGPVASMPNLASLSINNTPVTDLKPLAGLQKLSDVLMSNTPITDLTPLLEIETDFRFSIGSANELPSSELPAFIARQGWKTQP